MTRALAATLVVLVIAAWLRWRGALPALEPALAAVPPTAAPGRGIPQDTLDAYVEMTAGNDPFRLSNHSADIRYDPRTDGLGGGTPTPVPQAPRPQLVVKGIVGGPPWQAIVDGIPGQPAGTIIRAGATFDKLVVRSVSRDTVVVQGPDTTWKLTLGRPRS